MDINLNLNGFYTKNEIEDAFNTKFGSRIKGINLRRDELLEPYIILFATAMGAILYGDRIDGGTFYYKGEGQMGDQKLTPANKALINSNINNELIYAFRQEEVLGKFKYLGLVSVIDWSYIEYEGRMVYDFKFKEEGIGDSLENTMEWQQLKIDSDLPEATLMGTPSTSVTSTSKKIRDNAFRMQIKKLYKNRCAICGKKRFTVAAYPEIQAAHIFPKEKNGSDDWRNGLALCRLHHWAFDGGLIAISDALKIMVRPEIKGQMDYEEIFQFEGKRILLPTPEKYKPVSLYLEAHRKLHGFTL